jgi:hypothetical protein
MVIRVHFFILMLFDVLVSMAGPTPNYAIQHVLSTRQPREAALELMMPGVARPRFLLIAGIRVLGMFFQPTFIAIAAAGVVISKSSCRKW